MPIKVTQPFNNDSVLECQIADPWTPEDFYTALEHTLEMWETSKTGKQNLILDLEHTQLTSGDMLTRFSNIPGSFVLNNTNLERIVFVQANADLQASLSKVSSRRFPNVYHTTSLDEAYKLLD